MKILHGTCLFSRSAKRSVGQGTFFLWGESTHSFRKRGRGRPPKIPRHPFHATRQEILKIITSNNLLKDKRITQKAEDITRIFLLPSRNKFPQASSNLLCKGGIKHIEEATKLSQWKITGISLQLEDALLLLISLTDSTFKSNDVLIGEDLIFWGKFYKLALEMLIKQKFLPGTFNYDEQHDEYEVNWEYLLVSEEDKTRMNKLVKVIPPVCMANIYNNNNKNNNKNGTTDRSRKLFLSRCLVKLITGCIKNWLFSSHRDFKNHNFSGMWLQSLLIRDTIPSSELLPYKNDINKISRWKNQRTEGAAAKFKVCFRLDEPRSKEKNEDSEKWHLQYYLQDIKDPSLIVPAKKVWAESKETLNFLNRKYNRPQEKLLMGLGKASQIYNPIEKSLHQSKPEGILLTTAQAHQFLKEAAVLLKQSGFSVLIPSWWKSNKKKSTIGLKLTLKSKKSSTTSKGILTYEGIIKYNWQLALGDETLSKEEFKKIVELKEPLT
ncbi:MAG: SNF2 helicase-associated domain-containing protein, partial [Promethearchaeia archaeon]